LVSLGWDFVWVRLKLHWWLRLGGFGGWGLNQWLWVARGGLFQWWVLGISFSGCGLLLVGVLVVGILVGLNQLMERLW